LIDPNAPREIVPEFHHSGCARRHFSISAFMAKSERRPRSAGARRDRTAEAGGELTDLAGLAVDLADSVEILPASCWR
jgi:hypothetical protein